MVMGIAMKGVVESIDARPPGLVGAAEEAASCPREETTWMILVSSFLLIEAVMVDINDVSRDSCSLSIDVLKISVWSKVVMKVCVI